MKKKELEKKINELINPYNTLENSYKRRLSRYLYRLDQVFSNVDDIDPNFSVPLVVLTDISGKKTRKLEESRIFFRYYPYQKKLILENLDENLKNKKFGGLDNFYQFCFPDRVLVNYAPVSYVFPSNDHSSFKMEPLDMPKGYDFSVFTHSYLLKELGFSIGFTDSASETKMRNDLKKIIKQIKEDKEKNLKTDFFPEAEGFTI